MKKLSGLKKLILPLAASFIFNSNIRNSSLNTKNFLEENLKNDCKKEITEGFKYMKNFYHLHDDSTALGDYWKNPLETAFDKRGDCEDIAIFFQDFMREKGVETYLNYGYLGSPKDNSRHIWLQYNFGKDKFIVDFRSSEKDNHAIGVIYDRKKLPKDLRYIIVKNSKYLNKKIQEYEKRNNTKLFFNPRYY